MVRIQNREGLVTVPIRIDGSCPNYRPDLDPGDCPCDPDVTGVCVSCGFWAPIYHADRSRPVVVPQGVMRRLTAIVEAAENLIDDVEQARREAAFSMPLHAWEQKLGAIMLGFGGGHNHLDDLREAITGEAS